MTNETPQETLKRLAYDIKLGFNWLSCVSFEHMSDGQYDSYRSDKLGAEKALKQLEKTHAKALRKLEIAEGRLKDL